MDTNQFFNKAGPALSREDWPSLEGTLGYSQEKAVRMASSSNGRQILTHGVNAVLDHSTFDLDQGLADTALWRNGLQLYEYLEVPDGSDPLSSTSQMFRNLFDGSEPHRTSEYEGWVPGGPLDTNSVPMQLLNLAEQERAALSVIYPKAKVEGNCITTTHYVVVVKLFLRELMLSENRIEGVPHPKAYARLLSRLSRELGTCLFDADSMLDPADYAGCLGEMLKDMEETWKILKKDSELHRVLEETWGPDVCVYVRRATDIYAQCLLDAANALNSY